MLEGTIFLLPIYKKYLKYNENKIVWNTNHILIPIGVDISFANSIYIFWIIAKNEKLKPDSFGLINHFHISKRMYLSCFLWQF